jgi:hypothetical protein
LIESRKTLVLKIQEKGLIGSVICASEDIPQGELHVLYSSKLGRQIQELSEDDEVTLVLYANENNGEGFVVGFENRLKVKFVGGLATPLVINSSMLDTEERIFRGHKGFESYELRITSPAVDMYKIGCRP